MQYKAIIESIRLTRKNDLLLARANYLAALKKHSELKALDDKITALTLSESFSQSEYDKLESEKQDLIAHLGLDAQLFNPPPRCAFCGDSGYSGDKVCACVISKISKGIESGLTFEDFDLEVFEQSDRERIRSKLEIIHKFIEKFPQTNILNLILLGSTGTGKTFLASCIATAITNKGCSVIFVSAFEFVNTMLKFHTLPVSEKLDNLLPILECDLLIIDDLGTESLLKNVTVEYFSNILNERMSKRRHTLITTNLDDTMLSQRYGERIASRLFDKRLSLGFALSSKDLRKK